MTRTRTPPPGQFKIREVGFQTAAIICVRCDRVVGQYTPQELFRHIEAGTQYACKVCDRVGPA